MRTTGSRRWKLEGFSYSQVAVGQSKLATSVHSIRFAATENNSYNVRNRVAMLEEGLVDLSGRDVQNRLDGSFGKGVNVRYTTVENVPTL